MMSVEARSRQRNCCTTATTLQPLQSRMKRLLSHGPTNMRQFSQSSTVTAAEWSNT